MDHISKRAIFLNHVAQTSTYPLGLEISHAEGVYIYDTNGKRYFDLNSGISVSSLGHKHPIVIQAVKDQLDLYMHTMVYGEHIQNPQVRYAKKLSESIDDSLDAIYYLSSGSEVLETAMKLIRKVTGRYEIIACKHAYHGSTLGAESLRSDIEHTSAYAPLIPHIKHITYNNVAELENITCRTAGIILEPVQAEAGVILPHDNYLQKVRQRCNDVGALMVLDEIQTGFGRTGYMFAHQKYDVIPDMMCIGKAMGGGMPIGGLVANQKLLHHFAKYPDLGHITTFGGHPVICAAALATLEVLQSNDIISQVLENEKYIRNKLQHPIIKEIRSSGMMMAVELTKRKYLKHVVNQAFEGGALIDYFLFNNRSFRLAPPLIYKESELAEALGILLKAMDYAQDRYA